VAEGLVTDKSELGIYFTEHTGIVVTEEIRRIKADTEDKILAEKLGKILPELEALKVGLVVPILDADVSKGLKGLLLIGEKLSGGLFDQQDLELFGVLAPQLSAALQKSQLYSEVQDYSANLQKKVESATIQLKSVNDQLESRNGRLNTLQKFSNVILQSYRLEEMSQRVIDYIPGEIPGCDISFLVMLDEKTKELYGRTISQPYAIARQIVRLLGSDLTKYRVSLTDADNLLVKGANEKKIVKSKNLYDFLRPGISKALCWALQNLSGSMLEAVGVPLIVRGQVIGMLGFTFNAKRAPLTDEDYLLLQAVGDQVGIALERTRVYDELEKLNERLNEANHYLQQLDQAKSEFLSIASHQLRTPTTGIKGFLSMMLEGDYGQVTKEQREVLQVVYDSTNRLIRLVNVFLNVSRIESGKLQLARADVDLANLAKVVVTELRPAAKARGLVLDLQSPEKVPTVPADSDKIRDVLVNLTDNAIKYTEKGSVTVRVSARPTEVEVAVEDTGMGLSADEIKALFAKFSRGERVKIKESQGSGLGLFIAKKIIEAHSGKIGVTSPGPGKGTTFSFTLPIKPPADAPTTMSTLPTPVGGKTGEGKK
jgi:signal transduction histidine kinase